ncbi:hypothetical protein JX266_013747 [Neoarthrinium moseri]|nr:hypothetical protein JX266_013747 [Neoarthrinium moseri]
MMEAEEGGRPRSVQELSKESQDFHFNKNVPLKHWLRTAKTLNTEAGFYLREGNFPQAFMLFMRQSDLIMNYINGHPEAKTPEGKIAIKKAVKDLPVVFMHLEKIKPIIQRDYDEWQAKEAKRRELYEKQGGDKSQKAQTAYDRHAARDPALSAKSKLLDAGENLGLAVDLARREIKRRDDDKRASRQAGMSAEEEQQRRTAGFWNNWTDELAKRQAEDEEFFRTQMESSRRKPDGTDDSHIHDFVQKMSRAERERDGLSGPRPGPPTAANYHYPSISKSTPLQYDATVARPRREAAPQPPRPPKDFVSEDYLGAPAPPSLPELPSKEQLWPPPTPEPLYQQHHYQPPAPPPKELEVPPEPTYQTPTPPERRPGRETLTFKPAAYLESGDPIRCVIVPVGLREDFLKLAAENTRRGLEMCGILCGTAVNNALFVTCLVIPEQTCTSDTCETENEGAIFDYCIQEDLLQLGWIHTHPTQTCFMSSRDLHTQAGYQVMLPESIAIVCAPKFEPSYGIFRLTNPPGLPHILQCSQQNTFHQHSIDNLYTGAAERPGGHVYETEGFDYYVHDLRPGAKNTKTY